MSTRQDEALKRASKMLLLSNAVEHMDEFELRAVHAAIEAEQRAVFPWSPYSLHCRKRQLEHELAQYNDTRLTESS